MDERDPQGKPGWDIWILPLFGGEKPFPFLQSQFNKRIPRFPQMANGWPTFPTSPAGGKCTLCRFRGGTGKWQVSTEGANQPRWRQDGRELFYLSADNRLMAAEVQEKNGSLEIGNPKTLFQTNSVRSPFRTYDVTSDGKKFVIITQPAQTGAESITLVVNWPALLKNSGK